VNSLPLLSLLVFTPWAGAALLAVLRRGSPRTSRLVALAFSLSTLALSVGLLASFDPTRTSPQFVERQPWITALNVHYHLGLDGLSLVLVLLTGLVTPAALLASWRLERSTRLFSALFLALQGAALGVFLAQDFFHWFIFWELSLVPAFFLIKLWGGPGATRAAYQFVVYTIGGSAFMLDGLRGAVRRDGHDGLRSARATRSGWRARPETRRLRRWWPQAVFLGVLLGLAVKVPLWPFHTWLPPAYAEAPVGASMFLTGVMSKMGVYGFLRILWPIFPAPLHAAAPVLLWLALGGRGARARSPRCDRPTSSGWWRIRRSTT
jgi:NADH-quinone oxidoreductase subunit M